MSWEAQIGMIWLNNKTAVFANSICKSYWIDKEEVQVLDNLSFKVREGDFAVITGVSGEGKTTLLNIIATIDKATKGKIIIFGHNPSIEDEPTLSDFRCKMIGYVFQSYNLISTLTAAENVAFPMEWTEKPADHIKKRVDELLDLVGLPHRMNHFPSQLSGGEQQRVAFARALANDPWLLLADEPTGNLDEKSSKKIIQVLKTVQEAEKTIMIATHDKRIWELANLRFCLKDGKLASLDE